MSCIVMRQLLINVAICDPSGASQVVLVVKNPPANAGDTGSIPGLGRCPEVGNDNPLQYACLENSRDRGAWWAIVHGVERVGHDGAHTYTRPFWKSG